MATSAVSVKFTARERSRIKSLARKKKRSAHFLMREAVLDFVEREEKRMSFIAEAEDAWKDYRETGLHITLDEAETWMAEGSAKPPPWHK